MRPRIAWLLPAAVVLTACPKASLHGPASAAEPHLTPEQTRVRDEVDHIASEVATLLETQSERIWTAWTQGTPAAIPQTYAGREALVSGETLQKVDQLRQVSQDGRNIRALTALHSFLVGELLGRELGDLNDAVANLEASLTFTSDGREVRLRELDRLLASEPNAARRKALWEDAVPALERLNRTLKRQQERTEQLVRELGYDSSEAFAAELRQADFDELMLQAEALLDVTEAPYREVMGKLSQRELGVPFAKLTRADLPRLFRAHAVDRFFPKEALLPRVDATLSAMGLSLEGLPQLTVDAAERPRKSPRPLALAVKGPSDVRLSMVPNAGVREQAATFRAVGQALHMALTTEQRFELARLGGAASSMAFGLLFQDLVEDPVWLEEYAGLYGQERAEYLAAAGAQRLFLLRRDAGRLLYQLRLWREQPDDPRELYSEVMARTDLLPVTQADTARFLLDLDELFQSGDRLRAQLLAGQLQGELKARFGPAWWHRRDAGELLRKLFAAGMGRTPREVARVLGAEGLVPDVLLLRLGTTLGVPIRLDAAGGSAPAQ
ncbi:MAG: chromosome segregation protein SMC [Myxococcaceae bacterium]|nr:chromosome segregation protein SMC [Myxococcaceae bacterium]MCI0672266.1 chromosome segregation protein SMC [Myxococcaceae bacterium]